MIQEIPNLQALTPYFHRALRHEDIKAAEIFIALKIPLNNDDWDTMVAYNLQIDLVPLFQKIIEYQPEISPNALLSIITCRLNQNPSVFQFIFQQHLTHHPLPKNALIKAIQNFKCNPVIFKGVLAQHIKEYGSIPKEAIYEAIFGLETRIPEHPILFDLLNSGGNLDYAMTTFQQFQTLTNSSEWKKAKGLITYREIQPILVQQREALDHFILQRQLQVDTQHIVLTRASQRL